MRISGHHSQYITNIHLESFVNEIDFSERVYPNYSKGLFDDARAFLKKTNADPNKTLVIISAGKP